MTSRVLEPGPFGAPGGTLFSFGHESDADGALAEPEIEQREAICDADGEGDLPTDAWSTSRRSRQPPSAQPAARASRAAPIATTTDSAMTTSARILFACNGATRPASLVEPGSARCPAGGIRIDTGAHVDADSVLATTE